MKVVLFVDDEKLITRALSQIFDDNQYVYIFKNSAVEALDYMEHHTVDLICTDIVMPDVNGFVLLGQVQELYPRITRIALSSFSNKNQIKKLINQNLAQFYLFKPWDDNELKRSIYKILNMQSALYSKEMLKMVHSINDLPTLPDVYKKLSQLIKNESPIEEISGVISEDQSIAAATLRIANSAFYGRKTGDIAQAIMNIGLDNLKNIVLSHSVFESLSENLQMLKQMWQHAALSNKIMTAIYSECLNKPIPNQFASVSLLHDIGKLLLITKKDEYRQIAEEAVKSNRLVSDIEKEKYGVCHQDIGAYLLNSWDLPFAYVEAAMYHHRPLDYRIINRELVGVVHLAHHYSEVLDGDDSKTLDHKVFKLLDIKKEVVDQLIEMIKE